MSHVNNTLGPWDFFIWQMFTLRLTVTMQIYNTPGDVTTALAQTQLLVTF